MNIKKIIEDMTIDEKILFLQAKDNWTLNGIERLGISPVIVHDGPSGLNWREAGGTTALPVESILSASWNCDLIEELGYMVAEECQEFNTSILLGPGVNAKRSPLGGRNFEYYSEDPYLSGKLGAAFIRGVQSGGIGTSLKHYVANDQETKRFTMNAVVDERTLAEISLKPFEICIREGRPWTVMGAYNQLNGEFCCQNSYLLNEKLRKEFEFDGVMLTDWGACVDKVLSHKNGLDLETGSYERADELKKAVEKGDISEKEIDAHVERVLELFQKIYKGKKEVNVDWEEHYEKSVSAAEESIVLLKNDGDILPLNNGCKIAFVGDFAVHPRIGGGGSSGVVPRKAECCFECAKDMGTVAFAQGYEPTSVLTNHELLNEAVNVAEKSDTVVVFMGTTELQESEGSDRTSIFFPQNQVTLLQEIAKVNENVVVVNASGSAMDFRDVLPYCKALLHTGLSGSGGGRATANILFGKTNPSGKLTETFPVCIEHTPAYPSYPGKTENTVYGEGIYSGYRYYDKKKLPVQFPFGYGLSYTTFSYDNLRLSDDSICENDEVTVFVDIMNTGSMKGKEVVQFYVTDVEACLDRPEKELKAFAKVELKPGEKKTVSIKLKKDAFAYYIPHLHRFEVESGEFIISAASSSRDIHLEKKIEVRSDAKIKLPLTEYDTISEYLEDDTYGPVTKKILDSFGITELNPAFPIVKGILAKDIGGFLSYFNVDKADGIEIKNGLLNNREPEILSKYSH
ncbi:MAG: glycoside hydrolase family 3 C-terminal domain-containing protein [Lachnospiraceae bacterium]|nr:glycoside hydrolase family 3 C-terminal domain-containing protein [Lachnospiraceae bacterium]